MTFQPDAGAEADREGSGQPADWSARAGAFSIDVLFGLAALVCLGLLGWSAPQGGWLWWICTLAAAAVLLAVALNRMLLPVITGWSVGRRVFAIAVVERDGSPVGPWRLLLRDAAHLLDTLPVFLGWLLPLLDPRRRTFADIVARTEVREVPAGSLTPPSTNSVAGAGQRDLRIPPTAVVAGAAAVAAVAALVGYAGIYRQQSGAERTRAQISIEGPKIVTDMLSYTAKSVAEDFAHDQELVTDAYRPQLSEQQDTVRKNGPVDNEYWSTNSAVLSAEPDRAAMLLLLQGQRGTAPKQRLITASVRVNFVRAGSGQWKIDDLTVLGPAKPQAPPAAPATPTAEPKPGKSTSGSPAKPPAKSTAQAPAPAPTKAPVKPSAAPTGPGR